MNEGGGDGRSVVERDIEASSPGPSYGMTSTLRQRLMKSRRSFELTHPKRRCFAGGNHGLEMLACGTEDLVSGTSPSSLEEHSQGLEEELCTQSPNYGSSPGAIGTPESETALLESQGITLQQLWKELEDMKAALETKDELLRRLRMVCTYRKKNNLEELERLIFKWRSACQTLLCDLQQEATSNNIHSLGQIISGMGLDPALLQYNPNEDTFT